MRGATYFIAVVAICGCGSVGEERLSASESAASKTQLVWARQFGTMENDQAHGGAVCGGAFYAVGRTDGALALPNNLGDGDAFVRKYDLNGTVVWTRQFGGLEVDSANGIACDASGIYVAGRNRDLLQDEGFVRKFDHMTGDEIWSSSYSPGNTDAVRIALDATGVYVVGSVAGAFSGEISAGGGDAYVKKLELGTARTIWTKQFGTSETDYATGVFVDPTGVYVAGLTAGQFEGQQSAGSTDAFVRKYDLNGTEALWTTQFGTSLPEANVSIAGDSRSIYVATNTSPTADVRRFDRAGTPLWVVNFDGAPHSIIADDTGAYVGGLALGGVVARKLDPRGRVVWSHLVPVTALTAPTSIATDRTGVYLGGMTLGAIADETNLGGVDAFALKIALPAGSTRKR